MRLILPILLAIVGAASGVGAGLYLKPVPSPHNEVSVVTSNDAHAGQVDAFDPKLGDSHESNSATAHSFDSSDREPSAGSEFVKLSNQFVVPVLHDGRVVSMVVLSLSLETTSGFRESIFALEPRIRDTFLQVLFDHANMGGFDGAFTGGDKMKILKRELKLAGQKLAGQDIRDILVTDIARQDL